MDIQIRVREGRKVMAGGNAEVEKWRDYEETVVEGGEELAGLVGLIKERYDPAVVEARRKEMDAKYWGIREKEKADTLTVKKIEKAEARAEERRERKAEDRAEAKKQGRWSK